MQHQEFPEPRPGRSPLGLAAALVAGVLIGALAMWLFAGRTRGPAAADADKGGDSAKTDASQKTELPAGVVEVDPVAQKNAGVVVVRAETRTLPATLTVTGSVAPVESKVAHIRPLARGVISQVSVSLGARVKRGQALATYDNIELGERTGEYLSERASLRQAESDLEVRQRALDRAEALIKIEGISQQELDLRRSEVRSAQAGVANARARVSRIEEQLHRFGLTDAEVSRLAPEEGQSGHRTASHSVLRAPIDGVVTKFDVAAGEVVEPERELFTVADISTVWVLADVYEKDLARLPRSGEVDVRVDAYPKQIFRGSLTYVSDVIDAKTRSAKVRCVVANPEGLLKLDLFATVTIPTNERRQSIVVPVAAVQQIDNQPVVFVRKTESQFERRKVTVGQTAGGVVEIVDGVRTDEEVVADGSFYMKTALLRERIGEGD